MNRKYEYITDYQMADRTITKHPVFKKEGWGDALFVDSQTMLNLDLISKWMKANKVDTVSYEEGMKKICI